MAGSPFLGPIKISPIAITGGRKKIVYLPNRIVGFELIATLVATAMAITAAAVALLFGMWHIALQVGVGLLLFAAIISLRYILYLWVKKQYYLDVIQA